MRSDLETWLLTEGRTLPDVPTLLAELGARLPGVDRIWAGTKLLHPQAAAYLWIWEDGRPTITRELSYTLFARLRQGDSPVRRLERGAPFVRFRPHDADQTDVTRDLWEAGYADLYGLTFTLRGVWAGGFTWASREPFSPEQIATFDQLMPALSAVLEPLANDLVMRTLLQTYLGQDAGTRVHDGAVKRGDGTTLRAAVWFSDLRGFTALSRRLDRDALLDLLNDAFEQVVGAIEAQDGQVLKFMGDGLLGVFPGDQACARAAAAAQDLRTRLDGLREARTERGLATADVGVGLHYGDVSYGNIGAPARLDFTVIGPAVNLAARIEGVCGRLGEPILASPEFAGRVNGWSEAGRFELKGVDGLVPVFKPPPASTPTGEPPARA